MYIQQVNQDGVSIALIRSEKPLMTDVPRSIERFKDRWVRGIMQRYR